MDVPKEINTTQMKGIKKKKKKKKKRCAHKKCNRKLNLTDMKCRCDYVYCAHHRYPETHNCSWDPKSEIEIDKYKLTAGLNHIVLFSKLERI